MKRGYKETEIGEIPVEWEVKELSDFIHQEIREKPMPKSAFKGLGIRSHCKGTFLKEEFDPKKLMMEYLYEVKKGDLIVNITFAWEGAIAIVKEQDDGALVSHRFPTYSINPKKAYTKYVEYQITQKQFIEHLGIISPGGAGRNRVLNKRDFTKSVIPLPPLPEQKKIAEILSSVDEAIRATQAVIDQTKTLKQGLLNQLLTKGIGHKKFKQTEIGEIPVEWEVKALGKNVEIFSGESPSSFELSSAGGVPFVKVEDLNNCEKYQLNSRYYTNDLFTTIKMGAIIFPKRGAAIFNNKVRITKRDIYVDTNIMALLPNNNLDSEFLFYSILQKGLFRIADTSSIPQINNKHIIPFLIPIPTLPEQKRIAEILSSLDEAIRESMTNLEQLKATKSGLMQDLLTGKKRVQYAQP